MLWGRNAKRGKARDVRQNEGNRMRKGGRRQRRRRGRGGGGEGKGEKCWKLEIGWGRI